MPVITTWPDEFRLTPYDPLLDPPTQFPVIVCEMELESNRIPGLFVLVPPVICPDAVTDRVPLFIKIPFVSDADPAVIFTAVTVSVPVLVQNIARPLVTLPPVNEPTTVAEMVEEPVTHDADRAKTLAVNVTPSVSEKLPPVVAPPVVSLRTSPVDPRSVDSFMVIV